jgi:hypothetical protein
MMNYRTIWIKWPDAANMLGYRTANDEAKGEKFVVSILWFNNPHSKALLLLGECFQSA